VFFKKLNILQEWTCEKKIGLLYSKIVDSFSTPAGIETDWLLSVYQKLQ